MCEEQRDNMIDAVKLLEDNNKKNNVLFATLKNCLDEDKRKTYIIAIIKKMLEKYHIEGINIDDYEECLIIDDVEKVIFFNLCPFSEYFSEKIHPANLDLHSVYSFKCPNHAIEMLENNDLRFTNLIKNQKNDPLEYQEFWYRLGNISRMIPDNYDVKKRNWLCNLKNRIPMDEDREKIFIYCLTRTISDKHWKEYGNDGKNICIEYDFEQKSNNGAFKNGKVYYDSGYDFDFLREINYYIRIKYGLFFNPTGWTNFAQFYKRDKYRWEDETRLSINLSNASDEELKYIKYKSNTDKDIICIKNGNPFINWKIKSITIGSKCCSKYEKEIRYILKKDPFYKNTQIIKRTCTNSGTRPRQNVFPWFWRVCYKIRFSILPLPCKLLKIITARASKAIGNGIPPCGEKK